MRVPAVWRRWVGLALLLVSCQRAPPPLVAEAVTARGGVERLHAVQSLRLVGKLSMGTTVGPLRVDWKRPGRMRTEVGLPQGTVLRVVDGPNGWASNNAALTPLQPMSQAELARAQREADMDGPFVDSAQKGIHFALVDGGGAVSGKAADALDVFFPDGTVQRYYLDAASHEPLGWDETRRVDGQAQVDETRFYRTQRVQGVLFPVAMSSVVRGGKSGIHITIDSVEVNPPLPDVLFRPDGPAAGLTP